MNHDPKRLLNGQPFCLAESFLNELRAAAGLVEFKAQDLMQMFSTMPDVSKAFAVQNGVAIIDVNGVIIKRMDVLSLLFGGVVAQDDIKAQFDAAMADDSVSTILFVFDSPGGVATGNQPLATHIFETRQTTGKVIGAVATGDCCSAAFWLASQCDFIAVAEDSTIGSIGVVGSVEDDDRQQRNQGVDTTVFRSSPMKGATAPPLQDIGARSLQDQINRLGSMFVDAALRRGRGMDETAITALGDPANVWIGADSVTAGLADEVATLDEIVARYATK